MKKIRYGLIGCGSMGREHIENIKALRGAEVTAIVDPVAASVAASLALFEGMDRVPTVFASTRALVASDLIDALVISTPNHTHIDVLREALQRPELHILVEKPLCTRVEDCLDIIALARGRSGIVWVAQEYRYMPPVSEMIRMTRAGAVGRVHQVAIREHRQPFYPKVGDWNRFNANTGGTLVEKCCHYFNLMDFILQEHPTHVFASGGQRVNHLDERYDGRTPDILDSAYVIVEYPSGARAMLDLCMFAESSKDKEQVIVVGDEGKLESLLPSLTLNYGRREDWGARKSWGESTSTGKGISTRRVWDSSIKYFGNHFGASYVQHEKFMHAIAEGLPPEVSLDDGLRAVATGVAAHRSIETHSVVAVRDVLPAGW